MTAYYRSCKINLYVNQLNGRLQIVKLSTLEVTHMNTRDLVAVIAECSDCTEHLNVEIQNDL